MLPTQEKKLKEFIAKFSALDKAFLQILKDCDGSKIKDLSVYWCEITKNFRNICNKVHKE